ncbi:endonuclease III [Lapidilactobacillus bayanensis]|uniref:endonuclease III n=1 Tax=Lapidilactobacillus bayanensis TaxID=2485998 RepID=UPI000F768926|nr:endonuclease III [Lapidilactobacillus bayanensis]
MLNKKQTRWAVEQIIVLYPNATPSLDARTPFQVAVSVLLSAQATDVSVNLATPALFAALPTPADFAAVTPEQVEPYIKSIGLYHNKAKHIVAMSQKLVNEFNGEMPTTMTELTSLPGIGRKSASVILGDAFGIPAFAVDTHITRIAKRLKIAQEKDSVLQIEKNITNALPKEQWIEGHHAMIYFGREVCSARNPQCLTCPLLEICAFGQHYVKQA